MHTISLGTRKLIGSLRRHKQSDDAVNCNRKITKLDGFLKNMFEREVISASLLTITLTLLGFSLLTFVHLYENPSFGEQFSFVERSASSDFTQVATEWFAARFLANVSKEIENLDKRVGKFERFSADEWRSETVSKNCQLVFILSLFLCGLFSSPSQSCASRGMHKENIGQKQKKNKRRNKKRKKTRSRTVSRTIKRGKKRY